MITTIKKKVIVVNFERGERKYAYIFKNFVKKICMPSYLKKNK